MLNQAAIHNSKKARKYIPHIKLKIISAQRATETYSKVYIFRYKIKFFLLLVKITFSYILMVI